MRFVLAWPSFRQWVCWVVARSARRHSPSWLLPKSREAPSRFVLVPECERFPLHERVGAIGLAEIVAGLPTLW